MANETIKIYAVASAGCSRNSPTTTFNTSKTVSYDEGEDLYIQFDAFPDEYKRREIIHWAPYVYATGVKYDYSSLYSTKLEFRAVEESFDIDTVTHATAPNSKLIDDATIYKDDLPSYVSIYPEYYVPTLKKVLDYGIVADAGIQLVLGTTRYSEKPYIEVLVSDSDVHLVVSDFEAASGVLASLDSGFSWDLGDSGDSFLPVAAESCTFQWKASGSSEIHEIPVTASSKKRCVVPAGTFPLGTISARVIGTDSLGASFSSYWEDFTVLSPGVSGMSPASGYVPKFAANTFSWDIVQPTSLAYKTYSAEQTSAIFRWRAGSSGEIHELTISGDTKTITVPADTFDADEIQWQVEATAVGGHVCLSDWMTLSTQETTPTAAPLSPSNLVVDAASPVTFQWQHTISTGTQPTKSELQKSADGVTWETLATIDGSEREWVCPANTLTSSIKYWRVRTYNTDGVASEWSEAAQIVVIAAPSAPAIQIKSTGPRPAISWQTSEQEAYQVELDGELSGGTHYGTDKTWQSPTYLADGSHTVRVRVQNQYGMWSAWGSAALPVANTPGESITLTVTGGASAELSWQSAGSYDFYLVYRDGKAVAKLTQTQYTDERSAGSVTYQIRGCYEDSSNYGLSDEVTVDVRPEVLTVSDLDTGVVLRLPYSDSQHRTTGRTLSRQIELLQLSGAYYPVAVEVDAGTDVLSVTAALTDESQVRQLMALVGKLVCVKTPQGDMVIGYITSLPRQFDEFMHVFNFTVERIDYNDEVSL